MELLVAIGKRHASLLAAAKMKIHNGLLCYYLFMHSL
jgi:hypothetical protein